MPNTIPIIQPCAEDGTPVSYVTRTNSIYRSGGEPLGNSLEQYMDDVDELSQEVTDLDTKITNSTKLRITDGRFFICKPSGVSLAYIVIPIEHIPSAVSATGFKIFHNSAWKDITLTESGFSAGELLLGFKMSSGVTLTDGLNYWARGSISCSYTD